MSKKHKIFVFGTLLPPESEHPFFVENVMIDGAGFPLSFYMEGARTYGDIVLADDNQLASLDALEGHPSFYKRIPAKAYHSETNKEVDVEFYMYSDKDDKKSPPRWLDGVSQSIEIFSNSHYRWVGSRGNFTGRGLEVYNV